MTKRSSALAILVGLALLLGACTDGNAEAGKSEVDDVIKVVWYPNESGSDMTSSRDEIGEAIEQATGKEVEHQLTTDYAIAIETMVNNNADLAFMGAQGYIEAKNGNDAIEPLVVPTGESGTLDDAVYHSWLAVNADNQEEFMVDGEFSLDTLEQKKMSFVSNSSTSGFVIPSSTIINHFADKPGYEDLVAEDLMEGGLLFSQVLFGNSHQGSAVNLLNDSVEVASFCDTCAENYVEVTEGEANKVGSIYKVKDDATEPFNTVAGSEFALMDVIPVLNAPFVANLDVMGQEDYDTLKELFSSDEIANNEKIFVPEESGKPGLFFKSANERFVSVEDEWFDAIRKLSK